MIFSRVSNVVINLSDDENEDIGSVCDDKSSIDTPSMQRNTKKRKRNDDVFEEFLNKVPWYFPALIPFN